MTRIAAATRPEPVPASDRAVAPSHNLPSPSLDAVKEFEDALNQREGFQQRIDQLIAASERAVCIDQDTAGRCADLGKQIAAALGVIEANRKAIKEPYLEAGRAVDNFAKIAAHPLTAASNGVRGKLDTFLREERAKADAERRRQEEQRRADEAVRADAIAAGQAVPEPEAPSLAPAPIEEPAPIRGDYGSLATARSVWKGDITDYTLAFIAVENNEKVREAIDKAVGALIRSGVRKIDGVRIFEDQAVSIR